MYEKVSEGTPMSPVFGSLKELVHYLRKKGTWWPGSKPWTDDEIERFLRNNVSTEERDRMKFTSVSIQS